jgi:hypothetical protein
MHLRRAIGLVVLTIVLTTVHLRAQEMPRQGDLVVAPLDSLTHRNFLSVLFDRNLNTYNWISRVALDTTVAAFHLSLRHQYLSNVIQTEPSRTVSSENPTSRQNNLQVNLSTPVTENTRVQTQWSTLVYSDNKTVGLNNASFHSLLGGVEYFPWSFLSFTPMGGYRWDNQGDMKDAGPSVDLSGRTHGADLDGYWIMGRGQYHKDFLSPRTLEDDFFDLGIQKLFTTQARDSVRFGFSRNRREFYGLLDSTIESRLENIVTIANQLDYEFDHQFVTSLFAGIMSRSLDKDLRGLPGVSRNLQVFDTRIDEFRIDTYMQAIYHSEDGRTHVVGRFAYNERDEAHAAKLPPDPSPSMILLYNERNRQEQSKDNITRRTSIAAAVDFPVSGSDRLGITGSASILRYDTPSELNVEDRDEQLLALTITSAHSISRMLDLGVALDASLSRLVYLLKERSANNNHNRVLRLVPRATYRLPGILTSVNAFEVLANYTVYDYEDQVALAKSFSYRQFSLLDSTAFDFTHRLGLDFFAYLKLYERGQLDWNAFTERTENSFVDQTYDVQLRFTPSVSSLFAVGARYFSQSRYAYDGGVRTRGSFLRSVGPTCRIVWEGGPHSLLIFRGWYERKYLPDGTERAYPGMTFNLLLTF